MDWEIVRWRDVESPEFLTPRIDEIFFDASATRSFPSDAARAAFRERWLGRYLEHFSEWFYVVTEAQNERQPLVLGYLAGCIDDPARCALFADIGYFEDLRELTACFPAHLHINFAEGARSQGIGSALVQQFCEDAGAAGSSGVHVVTSAQSRNVAFYNRCGFNEVSRFKSGMVQNVMLARRLD